MLGIGRRREKAEAEARSIAKNLRVERLSTMRFYRRKRMWQALQRARLELALRKALPPILLYTLLAAAAGLVIGFALHWLRH